jgi:hypothetical protein
LDNRNTSGRSILLNGAVLPAGLGLALLWSIRHARWGPEGAVGGGILRVPCVFLAGGVTAALIVRGSLLSVPGGRSAVRIGLLISLTVPGYWAMANLDTKYEWFAESRIANDRVFQQGLDAEFRALGKDAPRPKSKGAAATSRRKRRGGEPISNASRTRASSSQKSIGPFSSDRQI